MSEQIFNVVWPLGNPAQSTSALQRRNDGLRSARIAFAWDYAFKGDKIWEIVCLELRRQFPNITFVGPEEFGNIHDKFGFDDIGNTALRARVRDLDISGAIVGVGA